MATANTGSTRTPLVGKRQSLCAHDFGDRAFHAVILCFAGSVLVITVLIGALLTSAAWPSIKQFGLRFLTDSTWDPVAMRFGAWPYIYGTLVSSLLALLVAVPIGLCTAFFLAELAPRWMREPVGFLVELLAAVPSVVYGLWGVLVMVPWLQSVQDAIGGATLMGVHLGELPFFAGGAPGRSMMAGALILTIMVLPFVTSVSRQVIRAVPQSLREAAFGLGATRCEVISGPILRAARSGIMGAIVLGLARAIGETMAITMVIGNGNRASLSLFAPGNTLASVLANNYAEAGIGIFTAALMHIALTLFVITIAVNALARLLIFNMTRGMGAAGL